MKVALVYDRVNKLGGAERVLQALHEIWPKAPLYTAVYDPKKAPLWVKNIRVIPSFLNKVPGASGRHEWLAPLMPLAFESFNFADFDAVVSVTSEAAKGIITRPETLHICYCLTPTRYLYSGYDQYFSSLFLRFFCSPVVTYLRHWDQVASQRPDHYLAISKNVQKRIRKYYQQNSETIYPPVDTGKFQIANIKSRKNSEFKILNSKYFLVVSRLVAYKRVDIVIKAFNRLGLSLKVIGTGNQEKKLKRMAKKNIEFLGALTDQELLGYYQGCQAVIFPTEEDFGIVPLEAQACGRPVIVYRGGGALETVIKGKTGVFFYPQTDGGLAKVIKSFKAERFSSEDCRQNAKKFSQVRFKKEFKKAVLNKWKLTRN